MFECDCWDCEKQARTIQTDNLAHRLVSWFVQRATVVSKLHYFMVTIALLPDLDIFINNTVNESASKTT